MNQSENVAPDIKYLKEIKTNEILPSKTNPRSRFDPGQMDELIDSIHRHGILQPILVREIAEPDRYELVAGERRLRAALKVGLIQIPAYVRSMTDQEVLEFQLVENLQRTDLHPLEEAEGYQRLIVKHGYTADDLAIKVAKSKAWVYARLKLTQLPEPVKKIFWSGKISPSVALLVARIPDPKLQEKAAKEVMSRDRLGGPDSPMSTREAARHIQEGYMLRLAGAPFKTDDADLVPKAGPCTTCPKRTGNQPELFGDIKSADVCTDPKCFNDKEEAAWFIKKAEASLTGQKVLNAKEVQEIFMRYPGGDELLSGSPYIEIKDRCHADPKARNWQKLLGKHSPSPILARDSKGQIHKLLKKNDAQEALKAAGHKFLGSSSKYSRPAADIKREKEARVKAEIQRNKNKGAIAAIVDRIEKTEPDTAFWKVMAKTLVQTSWHDTMVDVARRRQLLKDKKRSGEDKALNQAIEGMSGPQLRALACELIVTRIVPGPHTWSPGLFNEVCRLFKVDLAKIEREIRADRKDKQPAKKKKAAKRG